MSFGHNDLITFHALNIFSFFAEKEYQRRQSLGANVANSLMSYSFDSENGEHTWVLTRENDTPIAAVFGKNIKDNRMEIRTVVYGKQPFNMVNTFYLNLPLRGIIGQINAIYNAVTEYATPTPLFNALSRCLLTLDQMSSVKEIPSVFLSTSRLYHLDDVSKQVIISINVRVVPFDRKDDELAASHVVELSVPFISTDTEDYTDVDEMLIRESPIHEFFLLNDDHDVEKLTSKNCYYQRHRNLDTDILNTVFCENDDNHFWYTI